MAYEFTLIKCMEEVDVQHAKTHLSKILNQVAIGEEVVITKAGKPVARLLPIAAPPRDRILGTGRGDYQVPEDFNDPLPEEVLREFIK